MALQDGLKLRLLVDGVHQVLMSEISLEIDGQNQPLETLEGLAGRTHGSGRVTISGTGIVPIGGAEFDYVAAVANRSYHDLQVPLGPKSYIDSGWFEKATVSQSTGKATEVNFSWTGGFSSPK
jgi:hypothetical protein